MSSALAIIKNAFHVWKDTTVLFWGSNGFACFFFVSLLLVVLFDKNKNRKYTYAGYSIIVLLGLYNPVTYYVCNKMFGGSYAYFTRLYSLVPVPFLIAYAGTYLIEKYKGVSKLFLFAFLAVTMVLGGTSIYREDWIQKAENYSKLSDEVIGVCEILHDYDEHTRVAAPSILATNIRQYDGSIMMPYGRDWGDLNPLRLQLDLDYPDVNRTLLLAGEYACDFIIVKNYPENKSVFSEKNQELYGETNEYLIYRIVNVPRVKMIYNQFCQVVEKEYLDSDGNLSSNDEGYAIVRYTYDDSGDLKSELFYDENDEPVAMLQGHSGIEYTYDRRHLVASETYLDGDGNPMINSYGYATIEYGYDKNDNVAEEYYFDENHNPLMASLGQYGVKKEYNANNRVTRIRYVDQNGTPISLYSGYSSMQIEYDEVGKIIGEYYYDENDNPVQIVSGQFGEKRAYNESNRLESVTYIGVDNKPIITSSGFALIKYIYDESGRLSEEYYFDENGTPIANINGQYGQRYLYNDNAQVEYVYYLDENGNTMDSVVGVSGIKKEYDNSNSTEFNFYINKVGNPTCSNSGIFGLKKVLNFKNQVVSLTYLGANNEPVLCESNYSTVKYEYDVSGNIIEERYYDRNDNPVSVVSGEYGKQYEYSENNLHVKEIFIDENGNPFTTKNGYSVVLKQYNEKKDICKELYQDSQGQAVKIAEGYYGLIREKNIFGQEKKLTYLDMNESPLELNGKGYSSRELIYSEDKKLTNIIYYDTDGEIVNEEEIVTWKVEQHSDASGNQGVFYTLYNLSTGSLIVIDGGMPENTESVRQVIAEYGGTVTAWIVTHYHADHASAFNEIQQSPNGINIKKVYASKFDSDYEKFLEVARDWDDPETMETWMNNSADSDIVYYPSRGETIKIDDLTITFLNTYDDKLLELNGENDLPNNCALVTLVEGQSDSMLFMSDMYSSGVGDYLKDEYGEKLKNVKYLQPCHHGNSYMPYEFYEYIDPEVMFFDAPEWLMEGDDWHAKKLKAWCDENGIKVYDFSTAPNVIEFH